MINSIFFVSLFFVMVMGSHTSVFAYTKVTPEMGKALIDSNDQLIVIDVREVREFCDDVGHIPRAINYPWNSGVLNAYLITH